MLVKSINIVHNDHDVPFGLIWKALRMIVSEDKSGCHVIDFGRVIGFNDLVEVSEDDEFYEKIRSNRTYPSRFVKNKLPVPCTKLAVVWRHIRDGRFQVITAYFTYRDNPHCPDEPGNIIRKIKKGHKYSLSEIDEAFEFWSTHAFVEPLPRWLL